MKDPGAAWSNFCARLAAVGDLVTSPSFAAEPVSDAEGIRHVTRLAVMALQSHLEFGDPNFPAFHRYDDDVVKWGGPNVDNHYLRARIDPAGHYRVVGDVRGVRDLIVSTHEGDMQLGQYGVYEERRLADFVIDADQMLRFDVGGPTTNTDATNANTVPLAADARILMIRVYVSDWMNDAVPWFDIERIDRSDAAPLPLEGDAVITALDAAAEWVERSVVYWRDYLEQSPVRALVNQLSPPRRAKGGSDRIQYGAGWWQLDDSECLVVEFEAPVADYWSIQLYSTPWFESLDVRNRLNSYTNESAAIDDDGIVRLAIGAQDPGIDNWLDTEGRQSGMIAYRFIGCDAPPTPVAGVEPHANVVSSSGGPSSRDRADQIAQRRMGIARRFHR